jgi:NCAIR mutase (PurE)-related protein
MINDVLLDEGRERRIGFDEAVFSETKSAGQLAAIVAQALQSSGRRLFTRLTAQQFQVLDRRFPGVLDYDEVSRTGVVGKRLAPHRPSNVAIVTGGSSDAPVAREAARTLRYYGESATEIYDVGVAGLWRLMSRLVEISHADGVIVVAGMEGALPTVLGGLIAAPIIAVPTSVGYGVSAGGHAALHSALGSCAPGIVVVNIDNGYGAACAMMRMLGASRRHHAGTVETDSDRATASTLR